jgi:hypothetical protein
LRKEGTCHPQLVLRKRSVEQDALRIEEDSHDYIFDEIFRRETLKHETRAEEEEEGEEKLYESGEE